MNTTDKPIEKAGKVLYTETLKHYQMMREGAQRDSDYHAHTYMQSKDAGAEMAYACSMARVGVWDEAIRVLTKNAGDWMRMDFERPTS